MLLPNNDFEIYMSCTRKQPRLSTDRWVDKEIVVHVYNGLLLSHKKERIWVSSNEVDEPRAYYRVK